MKAVRRKGIRAKKKKKKKKKKKPRLDIRLKAVCRCEEGGNFIAAAKYLPGSRPCSLHVNTNTLTSKKSIEIR
jgi:hypothetical protein